MGDEIKIMCSKCMILVCALDRSNGKMSISFWKKNNQAKRKKNKKK